MSEKLPAATDESWYVIPATPKMPAYICTDPANHLETEVAVLYGKRADEYAWRIVNAVNASVSESTVEGYCPEYRLHDGDIQDSHNRRITVSGNAGICQLLNKLDQLKRATASRSETGKPRPYVAIAWESACDGKHYLAFNRRDLCWYTAYTRAGVWYHACGDGTPRYAIDGVTHYQLLPGDPT